ncbi:MAG TPA: hypothetical protein VFI91_01100 [Longimicrobiaceae bacterium]|nr:hypothetical protein [Longimicrobiaceae bacterium]
MSCRVVCILLLALIPASLRAQEAPTGEWGGLRALELIQSAQARRMEARADTGLVNFQADARIYVYFYLDREDTNTRNLVKTDQLALEVFWEAPDLVKQRIVGWRDEKSLPTNIHYHLDHLTVVMENFGNEIQLGDGDEVTGVLHPAAPAAEAFYQYRLADSLTLRLPGAAEPVRVYEVEVRPRNLDQPGLIGSVFIDRRAGDIVRMEFTFTPSAYRDPYLDYINISLDNGLWKGRYWLPNQQRVEIRRSLPLLDIPAGSVIRATIKVSDYQFNQPLPVTTFSGPRVVTVSREERESFEFEKDLYADVREEGIGPEIELSDIRRQAREMALERTLSGAAGAGLSISRLSDVLRYNRAEGAVVGIGFAAPLGRTLEVGVRGGWAFGEEHPLGELWLEKSAGPATIRSSIFANLPRNVGMPDASRLGATLSSIFAASDPLDLFYARGVEIDVRTPLDNQWSVSARIRGESQASAANTATFSFFGDEFRPVREIDEAEVAFSARGSLRREPAAGLDSSWWSELALEASTAKLELDDSRVTYIRPEVGVGWSRRFGPADSRLQVDGRAGMAFGELPRQGLFLIGGRGTLPGYPLHGFGGDRFASASMSASGELGTPWVRGRLVGAVGWTGVGDAGEDALRLWGAPTTEGLKASAGFGFGLFHNVLHVDFVRGLSGGGEWEVIVDANQEFWDFL